MSSSVAERTWTRVISTKEALRALVGEPSERAVNKQMNQLDEHCIKIIGRSPFLLLGTSNARGMGDVSPRGDVPGFVQVLDAKSIAIPDRPGNKRTDSLSNIIENPQVGMLFIVPGKEETLRVNGRATIVQDDALLERMAVEGKRPLLAIVVDIEETFAHCQKAFIRSKLWEHETWPDVSDLPSMPRMMLDQAKSNLTLEELEQSNAEGIKRLY